MSEATNTTTITIPDNTVTVLEKLLEKSSTEKWSELSPTCFIILCTVMLVISGILLYVVGKLQDEHIRLIIYGLLMTIFLLFLIPISHKFFAFKLYEEKGKQEASRQNTAVQLYRATVEQLSLKDMSKEELLKLLDTST
ncbi:hypothetical protein [Treponema sp.]|uniref:hypothetical protein n=1 Tax=Treponema sp. TaxID=166 RepID=UPI003FA21D75